MDTSQPNSPEYTSTEPISVPASTPADQEKHQRLFQRGLKWLGVGVFCMAISFAINFLLFQADHSFDMPMYVLTTAGFGCIMKGLADILGF